MINTKQQLYNLCAVHAEQRIQTAQDAIRIAQASANDETKSSAGDKYETGRAMMQLEIEKNTVQLAEAIKVKQTLQQIKPDKETTSIQSGSLVITSQGNFYIAISAGQITLNDKIYFAISPSTPIGAKLMGQLAGAEFTFNNRKYAIERVC